MYIYIYDSFVNQKNYDKILARIETRITDLGLSGKIVRMGIMTSVHDVIDSEIKKGAYNIVAVGNNNILSQALNSIAKLSASGHNKNITLGFIPIGQKDNEVAATLGISQEENACNVLSARRIKTLDLGKVNDNYFLTTAKITTEGTKVEIDENYSIEINEDGEVMVINLPMIDSLAPENISSNAEDGKLELFINTKKIKKLLSCRPTHPNKSCFSFNTISISNSKHFLKLDECLKIETPVKISIAKEKINLIVGKDRCF